MGILYGLEREVLPDAHTLAAVLDACGKAGKGGLAASICMRSSAGLDDAWEIARYTPAPGSRGARQRVQNRQARTGSTRWKTWLWQAMLQMRLHMTALTGVRRRVWPSGDVCHISARCPKGVTRDIGTIIREIALACGGKGGGHRLRAGATVPCSGYRNSGQHGRRQWHHERVSSRRCHYDTTWAFTGDGRLNPA